MAASLKGTIFPELALIDITKIPIKEDPKSANHTIRRRPRKGLLDSFKSLVLSCGSNFESEPKLLVNRSQEQTTMLGSFCCRCSSEVEQLIRNQ